MLFADQCDFCIFRLEFFQYVPLGWEHSDLPVSSVSRMHNEAYSSLEYDHFVTSSPVSWSLYLANYVGCRVWLESRSLFYSSDVHLSANFACYYISQHKWTLAGVICSLNWPGPVDSLESLRQSDVQHGHWTTGWPFWKRVLMCLSLAFPGPTQTGWGSSWATWFVSFQKMDSKNPVSIRPQFV